MSVAVDDTRTFRSAVDLTPEDQQSNVDYFKEQGLDVQVEGEETPAAPVTPEPETPPRPVESQEPESQEPADPGADAHEPTGETPAIDGEKPEKLGWRAKKNQELRDLKAKLAERDGANEELRRQLAARETPVAASPATSLSPAPVAEAPKVTEPPKAKEFEKPRPVRPKYEDFVTADDPLAAYNDALGEHTEKLSDWKDEKREFDNVQKQAIQDQASVRQSAQQVQVERERVAQEKVAAIRVVHPDFDEVTNNKFNPVLAYVLRNAAKNGLEIGYQLGKPENADLLATLRQSSAHKETDSQTVIEQKIAEATFDVAEIAQELKKRAGKNAPPAAPKAAAAAASAQTPPPAAPPAKRTAAEPRSEEATPAPSRSRGAAADRFEDIPKGDYDARRKWREAHGEA
jgi:hypothetical protein